jgi:methionyl-tRNA formyltransferase
MPAATIVIDPQLDWAHFEGRARALRADLLVSWFFTRRIPMNVCDKCRLGGIGVHPSLLPRYRGPDPYFAAIDAGDAHTGVTVHRIAAEYDAGAIVQSRSIAIDPSWNAWQLARALDRPSLSELRDVVRRAAGGDLLLGTPQDEALATDAPVPDEELRAIRWNEAAERIVRRVRALAPNPGAVVVVGEKALLLLRAEVEPAPPLALLPGQAAVVDGRAVVRAGDAGVVLLEGEDDGGHLGPEQLATLIDRVRGK